jgi:CelD/BcsL family acetyltransferase involved in cellulose biosynthesis
MTFEITDPQGLAALAPHWHRLLARTPGASFFQTLEWLAAYWRHYGASQRLRVIVVGEQDAPSGIVPLAVRSVRRHLAQVRLLTYPFDDWGSFYGPIGPDPAATLTAALSHVRRTPRDWDLIELASVDLLGSDGGATEAAFGAAGFDATRDAWHTSALVDLSAYRSWDAYWAARESRWRNNVRRSEKKLAERGKVSYARYRPAASGDPRWSWYEACEQIARASWQGASQTGTTLVHDSVRAFLRDCHQSAATAGALDVNLLLVDDVPMAFNYAYHYRGYVYGLRTGYDPAAASAGAGTVLQARMIEDSFARGDRLYDLGPDYLECKRYWVTDVRPSFRYTHFPPGVGVAQLLRAGRAVGHWWRGGRGAAAGK